MEKFTSVVLGFTVSIYRWVFLQNVDSIVADRDSVYRSTQPMYYALLNINTP